MLCHRAGPQFLDKKNLQKEIQPFFYKSNASKFGSGALPGKMLLVRIMKN